MKDLDAAILTYLLRSREDYVSGRQMADDLGISRVSIWGRLGRLKEEGFTIDAVRNKGYRLVKKPRHFHPALVEALLREAGVTAELHFVDEIDSTNTEAERRLANGAETPLVVAAARQTRGRGRLGRPWHSSDKGNLYLSFAFRPNLAPEQMQRFTLWMGLCVCREIDLGLDISNRIKWPNDVFHDGRKLAGMLTEAHVDADHTRDVVFGLGLNVNSDPTRWKEDYADRVTSLSQAKGHRLDLNEVAARIIQAVLQGYEMFESGAYAHEFRKWWVDYDALNGKEVTARRHGDVITGTAGGVDESGSLMLHLADGRLERLQAADVTLNQGGSR